MNSTLNKIISIIAACTVLTACSNTSNTISNDTSSTDASASSTKESISTIDLSNVNWNVENRIVNGERRPAFDVTNNTNYLLTYVDVEFKRKDDVSDEEWRDALSWAKSEYIGYTDEELDESKTIHGYIYDCINPSETASDMLAFGVVYVQDGKVYDYVEPDLMTVEYVNDEDGNIHTAYYDYKNNSSNEDSDTEKAFVWPTSALVKDLPIPDSKYVETKVDSADLVAVDVNNYTYDKYLEYVSAVKNIGYINNSNEDNDPNHTSIYSASNDSGCKIIISFRNSTMDLQLSTRSS